MPPPFIGSSSFAPGSLLRLAGVLALIPLMAEAQSGDSDRTYPNVLAPIYTFGRRGAEPGALRAASAVAVGKDDLLYVADAGNHRIQIFTMNGIFRGGFGRRGTAESEFLSPCAIAAAPDGEIFVADAGGRLQSFSPEGKFLKAWIGLRSPRGIAVTSDRVYVSESDVHRIRVFPRREGVERSLGGVGSLPGRFQSPAGLAVDEEGFLYVADSGNHRIQKLNPEGQPVAQWGGWGAQPGLVSYPSGLACVGDRLYVADYANHRVQVFDRSGRLLKQWGAAPAVAGGGDGRLHYPEGLAVSPSGGLTVVSEPVEGRLQVFVNRDVAKVERVNDLPWWDGLHTRLHAVRLAPPPPGCKPQVIGALAASDVHAVFFFDVTTNALGPIAAAGGYGPKLGELNGIGGIAVDPEGSRAYVGDVGNRRIVLFELPRNPARRELFANTIRVVSSHSLARMVPAGTSGYSAEMATPGPISRGRNGRLYVLDRANQAILVCDPDLRFLSLIPVSQGVREFAVADDGSLVATDPLRSRVLVYGSDGREQAVWTLGEERTGPGEGMPWGVAIDDQGVVYISDALNDRILKVDREGRVLKRWGTTGRTNDRLSGPRSIAFYSPDRLIIEDYGNHRAQLCTTEGEWLGNYVAGGLATPIAIR